MTYLVTPLVYLSGTFIALRLLRLLASTAERAARPCHIPQKAERPMTAWDRINDLFDQGLTARTTDKQLVKGEA